MTAPRIKWFYREGGKSPCCFWAAMPYELSTLWSSPGSPTSCADRPLPALWRCHRGATACSSQCLYPATCRDVSPAAASATLWSAACIWRAFPGLSWRGTASASEEKGWTDCGYFRSGGCAPGGYLAGAGFWWQRSFEWVRKQARADDHHQDACRHADTEYSGWLPGLHQQWASLQRCLSL